MIYYIHNFGISNVKKKNGLILKFWPITKKYKLLTFDSISTLYSHYFGVIISEILNLFYIHKFNVNIQNSYFNS